MFALVPFVALNFSVTFVNIVTFASTSSAFSENHLIAVCETRLTRPDINVSDYGVSLAVMAAVYQSKRCSGAFKGHHQDQ